MEWDGFNFKTNKFLSGLWGTRFWRRFRWCVLEGFLEWRRGVVCGEEMIIIIFDWNCWVVELGKDQCGDCGTNLV